MKNMKRREIDELEFFDEDDESYDDYNDKEADKISSNRWEACEFCNAKVLFPPEDKRFSSAPSAIIHFIGGTGFGSLPQFAYGHFLEELSSQGNYVIVSTPPLSSLEELTSPLDHYRIAYEMARNFRTAYRSIIEDEYGSAVAQNIPILGLGHSLGSRIHVVCAIQSKLRRLAFPREGNILISFNNYYATKSIPFLYEVGMLSKKAAESLLRNEAVKDVFGEEWQTRSGRRDRRDTIRNPIANEEDSNDKEAKVQSQSGRTRRTRSRFETRRRGSYREPPSLREQAKRGVEWATDTLSAQLGQLSESLEFTPSPDDLIQSVKTGKYGVSKSLLVQFDLDDIDQSVVLATAMSSALKAQDADSEGFTDVKFARLRGNHLTPILEGRSKSTERGHKVSESELQYLISTITTYIEQIILPSTTKEPPESDDL